MFYEVLRGSKRFYELLKGSKRFYEFYEVARGAVRF